jgi:hypothetical protein
MRFASSMAAFLLLSLLGAGAPASAATLYVDDWTDGQIGTGASTDPYRKLQDAIDRAASGDTIVIRIGRHVAAPADFIDPICGNCPPEQAVQNIPVKRGFHIRNKSLSLVGESRTATILETHAGYGVLFDNANISRLENLTVTGGVRDENPDATSAAVVVRWTHLTVNNVTISDNLDHAGEGVVAGVGGIVGREGAKIIANNVRIFNNSWDGIALYRGDPEIVNSGPRATLNNVDVDLGEGVGIGATWDSRADITNTRVSRYWKGVAAFGNSQVTLRNSIVRNQEAWGVEAFGAVTLTAINNVIAFQGRAGLSQGTADANVTFTNNIVYRNGWSLDWWHVAPPVGIYLANRSLATVQHNDVYDNYIDACVRIDADAECLEEIDLTTAGPGNIALAPRFVDTAADDFRLSCTSPAINAGSTAILDTDGTRSDMGAYGGPASPQAPPSCGMADLQPTPITYPSRTYEAGEVIKFDSGIANLGQSGTAGFAVKWFIDSTQHGHGSHLGVPANTTLMNGNSAFDWTATVGYHTVTFTVDSESSVAESNEGNNSTTSATFYVWPVRPDLTPTPILYNNADLVAGRRVVFDSGVRNLKSAGTGNFNVKWFVNDVQAGYGVHAGVPGNTTVLDGNSTYAWTAVRGRSTIRFTIDVDNQAGESNETNNSTSIVVDVP